MCRRARSRPETLKPRVSRALAAAVALSGVHALARAPLLRSGKSGGFRQRREVGGPCADA